MRKRLLLVYLLAGLSGVLPLVNGRAPAWAGENTETVRPAVGKPLQAAQALMRQGKFRDALTTLQEVDGVAARTAYENYVLDYTRFSAANSAGDLPLAVKAFDALMAAGRLPVATQQQFAFALAGQYYRIGDYARAAAWAARHGELGGTDPAARTLRYQALYEARDFPAAARELSAVVQADEQAGRKPAEEVLQLLANAQAKQDNEAGYAAALGTLLAHYPKRDYWLAALQAVVAKPGFPDRLGLDVVRLRLATDTLAGASHDPAARGAAWFDAIQRALQAGYPGEAKAMADAAFASGALGKGPDAAREGRLRALVEQSCEGDRKTLDQGDTDAVAARSGDALISQGLNYVGYGDFDRGLPLIQLGIARSGLKQPEEAKLRLGYAQFRAGHHADAIKTWKSVAGNGPAADLARLWLLKAAGSDHGREPTAD